MEMDCKLVVDAIHSIRFNLTKFGSLITDSKNLVSRGRNLFICFVKKASKQCSSHSIIRASCSHVSLFFWYKTLIFL